MGFKDWIAAITGRRPQPPPFEPPPAPAAPTESDIMRALDHVEEMVDGGVVPAPVQSRVRRVAQTVRDTMPRLRNLGLGSPDAYSVMATATDYLPEAIGAYTRLPRQWADSRPIENGKTSLMLLIDQLDLLSATMDSIDTFKMQALDTMAATIGTLETEVAKSREYLDRVQRQDHQLASGALDLESGAAPGGLR